jgi:hypothetical protein
LTVTLRVRVTGAPPLAWKVTVTETRSNASARRRPRSPFPASAGSTAHSPGATAPRRWSVWWRRQGTRPTGKIVATVGPNTTLSVRGSAAGYGDAPSSCHRDMGLAGRSSWAQSAGGIRRLGGPVALGASNSSASDRRPGEDLLACHACARPRLPTRLERPFWTSPRCQSSRRRSRQPGGHAPNPSPR